MHSRAPQAPNMIARANGPRLVHTLISERHNGYASILFREVLSAKTSTFRAPALYCLDLANLGRAGTFCAFGAGHDLGN